MLLKTGEFKEGGAGAYLHITYRHLEAMSYTINSNRFNYVMLKSDLLSFLEASD